MFSYALPCFHYAFVQFAILFVPTYSMHCSILISYYILYSMRVLQNHSALFISNPLLLLLVMLLFANGCTPVSSGFYTCAL